LINYQLNKKFIEFFENELQITAVLRIPEHGELLEQILQSTNYENTAHPQKILERKAANYLINHLLNKECEIVKNKYGKPQIKNSSLEISISHSYPYVAVSISENTPLGIDIQVIKPNIKRVAHKFVNKKENILVSKANNELALLSIIWSAKECLYKFYEKGKLLYIENLNVEFDPFLKNDKLIGEILLENEYISVEMKFKIFENYVLVYTKKEITLAK
jgi:4'-phosphopantetheinyl transferase